MSELDRLKPEERKLVVQRVLEFTQTYRKALKDWDDYYKEVAEKKGNVLPV